MSWRCVSLAITSSGVNPFNAEHLPTAYATIPETHAYALSEYSIARCAWKTGTGSLSIFVIFIAS